MVYQGAGKGAQISGADSIPGIGLLASIFLIGGFYPLTQIYQHEADRKDGVTTISLKLGKRGSFVLCAVMYATAFALFFLLYRSKGRPGDFVLLQLFMLPVIIFFLWWAIRVWRDERAADFRSTMRMNLLASSCTNIAFIILILIHSIGPHH